MAIHRLLDGLREHSVTPVVFCPRLECESAEDPLVRSGFQVQRFRAFVPILGLSHERRKQLVAVGGNLMSFELVSALWRERELSIIHTHTLGRLGGIGLTLAKQRQLPFVVTIHGGLLDLPEKIRQSFQAPLERGWEWGKFFGLLFQSHRLLCDADAIVTCNEREAALLKEQLPQKRVAVQPHGVPLEIYRQNRLEAARAAFPALSGRQVLLSLGRIDPIKNQIWLVEQASAIIRKYPRALLVLAGPCTDEVYGNGLKERIRQLGLEQHVLITGGLPPNDPRLIGLLQSAEALVLPSLSETFGLVVLEAWAAGTMVLSARASGPSALIQNGENGWLFDLEQPETFHQALDWTLSHPRLAAEMVSRGAKLAEQYSLHALSGRMKALYQELIEERRCVT